MIKALGSKNWLTAALKIGALIGCALWIYFPVLGGHPVWDDGTELFKNTWITQSAFPWRVWFTASGPDYQPLKTNLEWIIYHLGIANPLIFHSFSLSLHFFSALLLWKICARFISTYSWIAALVFIIHPMAVSSVAWMAELKNTLSLPLLLLSADFFLATQDDLQDGSKFSVPAYIFYCLSLLCKSSGIMLPGFILLYLIWRNKKLTSVDVKHVIPFIFFSALIGLVTLYLQVSAALPLKEVNTGNLTTHLLNAIPTLGSYLLNCLWPVNLTTVYSSSMSASAWLVGLIYCVLLVWFYSSTNKTLNSTAFIVSLFGLFLLPVLGLFSMSFLLISPIGDHLCYISLACFCIALVLGINFITDKFSRHFSAAFVRYRFIALSLFIGIFLANLSRSYAKSFFDPLSLWKRSSLIYQNSWFCLNNLGAAQLSAQTPTEAIISLRLAHKINSSAAEIDINLSEAYLQVRDFPQAVTSAKQAIMCEPDNASAHYNLANALVAEENLNDAVVEFKKAEKIEPKTPEFHYNHALALSQLGLTNLSIAEFKTCIALNPDAFEAYLNIATLEGSQERWPEAATYYAYALTLKPDHFEANYGYADTLMALNKPTEAISHYKAALKSLPTHPGVLEALRRADLASQGH